LNFWKRAAGERAGESTGVLFSLDLEDFILKLL
jgi:hypothetical protein